jgi:hypothetical protein
MVFSIIVFPLKIRFPCVHAEGAYCARALQRYTRDSNTHAVLMLPSSKHEI